MSESIVAFVNGCFDILHCGHLRVFQFARASGDYVIVGLNSDRSVRELKGKDRPIIGQSERKEIVESIRFVDEVIIFDEPTPLKLIELIKPNIIVKGEDWIDREVVGSHIAEVIYVPMLKKYSTTEIINRIRGG
jgi:rfaE bifunctional protein nucleotidyltransferase chain/domain